MHFHTFVARGFDENDVMPCGTVVNPGQFRPFHSRLAYVFSADAAEVVGVSREAGHGTGGLDITDLPGIGRPAQKMLDGGMKKPQGSSPGHGRPPRPHRWWTMKPDSRGEAVRVADEPRNRLPTFAWCETWPL